MNAFICKYYCSLLFVRKKVLCVCYGSGGWGYVDKLEIYLDTVCFHRL